MSIAHGAGCPLPPCEGMAGCSQPAKLVLAPSFAVILVFVYGFIIFTLFLSFTDAKLLPPTTANSSACAITCALFEHRELADFADEPRHLRAAVHHHLHVHRPGLAILLDQKIRIEGFLRPVYLYPMALSFIVTGVAWKWFLDPGIGLEAGRAGAGAGRAFSFRWIKDSNIRDLHHRHRGCLADRPASSWRCSSPACAASTTRS